MSVIDFTARGMARNLNERLLSPQPGEGLDLIGKPSVTELAESTAPSRGTGSNWHAGNFAYVETAAEASGHDLTTAGGVALRIVGDRVTPEALGCPDTEDPAGREAFAPAIVTSMQQRRLNGVEMRDLVGRSYNPAHDASVCFNGFLAELAGEGITINDTNNLEVLMGAPIRPESGMTLKFGPGTTIKKGWAGATSNTDSLLSRADWSVDTDDFVIEGGIWKPASASQTGLMLSVFGSRWIMRNLKIEGFYGGQGLVFGGDDIRLIDVQAVTTSTAAGTGAFRMIGGRGFRGVGLRGICGDDVFQFVPVTSSTNARFNRSITDSYYIGCDGRSASARLMVAAIAGPQNENQMTATIRDCGWIGVTGHCGNRGLLIENTEGDGTVNRQIDRIVARDCAVDCLDQNGLTNDVVSVSGDYAGAIGKVTFDNVTIKNNKRMYGVQVASENADVLVSNCSIEGEETPIKIDNRQAVLTLSGGRVAVVNNGGGGNAGHLLIAGGNAGASTIRVRDNTIFEGIATNKAAIRLQSATAMLEVGRMSALKAMGATGTIGISSISTIMVSWTKLTAMSQPTSRTPARCGASRGTGGAAPSRLPAESQL